MKGIALFTAGSPAKLLHPEAVPQLPLPAVG